MKTENTLKNKFKFLFLYFNQKVAKNNFIKGTCIFDFEQIKYGGMPDYLELTPLSQISDEEAIEVSKIFGLGHLQGAIKELILSIFRTSINDSGTTSSTNGIKNWIQVFDYLRSKGFAVPWMDLEVEDLIQYGWIKLK